MRRRLAVLLCLVLAAASAFASGSTEAAAPEGTGSYKIGIITELASVMEETYKAAERLAEKYPDVVVHLTYPENTATEIETTISTVLSLAYDEDVKAIVFCSGVLGTAAAIEKVKEIRPDILTIVGVPVEDVEVTCAAADLSFRQNVSEMGVQIVDAAKEMGCEAVVHYSFARHMSSQAIEARANAMEQRAGEVGLTYLFVDTPDPLADTGRAYSMQFVLEKTRELSDEWDNKIAFFSSNVNHIEPMVTAVLEKGSYYTIPSDPSPFNGIPSALGIEVPDDRNGDSEWMCEQISAKLAELGLSGHMFNWPVPVLTLCLNAGFEYARLYCEGETDGKNDPEALLKAFNAYAPVEQIYKGVDYGSDVDVDNFYTFVADYVIL